MDAASRHRARDLFRLLRSGLRPHTRFVGFAAYRKGRYAWRHVLQQKDDAAQISLHRAFRRRRDVRKDDGNEMVLRSTRWQG